MPAEPHIPPADQSRLREALALHQSGRLVEASRLYDQVLANTPDQFDALNLLGALCLQRGDCETAIEHLTRAVTVRAGAADAWCNLGLAQLTAERPADAADSLRRALAISPHMPQAVNALARALLDAGATADARARAVEATRLAPGHPGPWRNRGDIHLALGEHAEAERCYRGALELVPDDPEVIYSLGLALDHQSRWQEALARYQKALELAPELGPALGETVFLKRSLCEWSGLEALQTRFRDAVKRGADGLTPFVHMAITDDRVELNRCSELWARRFAPAPRPFEFAPRDDGAITIGYLSSGFYRYPTAQLIAGVLERHDRERFRIVGLDASPDDGSDIRARLLAAFDEHIGLRHLPADEAARRIHAAGVDILVDLKGYSADAPTAVTALRPAPVQASWLGYPGSVGGRHVDYLIADPVVIPDDHRPDYPEAVVRVPHSYQSNDNRRGVPERTLERADCGLPADAVVLCSFNQPYKMGPEVFAQWMEILKPAPQTVLWLMDPQPEQGIADRLRDAASAAGVARDRLIFAPKRPQPEYLAQLRLADLFLDTFPYNAHTTAADALWMGCPVLTRPGGSFASRVAASLLTACRLEQLIAGSADEYREMAVALAGDAGRLGGLRRRLESERLSLPLFDTARFTRNLESAYRGMVDRLRAGAAPEQFDVGAD